jgi:3-hydroxyisobutyrate dehydrogenase-like beta-hydroxyacid dehydrogenase
MSETIGFIGTGGMGEPMALNLLKAGFPLRIYNRTPEKARPLAEQGAEIVGQPADVVAASGVIITMVANDAALQATTTGDGGLLQRLGPDNVYLVMSTVAPATAQQLARLIATRGATSSRPPSSAGPTPPRPGSSGSSSPDRRRRANVSGRCWKRWARGSSWSATSRRWPTWSSCAATS